MKTKISSIDAAFAEAGFNQGPSRTVDGAEIRWYSDGSECEEVRTWMRVRLVRRQTLAELALGWEAPQIDELCKQLLRDVSPEFYSWLERTGALTNPSLSVFNLGDYFELPSFGYVIGDSRDDAMSDMKRDLARIRGAGWLLQSRARLLMCLLADVPPFGWRASNSVIRLVQLAGLCTVSGRDVELVRQCAAEHQNLLLHDAYGLFDVGGDWLERLLGRANLA